MRQTVGLAAFVAVCIGVSAHAAPGGGLATNEIPWNTVGYQILNFGIVIFGIIFLVRKQIKEAFKQRRADYQQAAEKAMQARAAAEAANLEIKQRLEKLESTADQAIENSKAEAELMQKNLIAEAREAAARLDRDSQRIVSAELEKARTELRNSMIDEAINAAEVALKAKMSEPEQKRLQGEFVDKIQVARS